MSKKGFKVQASSSRAAFGAGFGGFGGSSTTSSLSYIAEPPDLTTISDGNVVVAFKSLSKKDDTTKTRALEDLLAYVQAHPHDQGGVEDAVLEAWVKVYPRASIDNARRVRELSHKLQYELLKSARKRMERNIPQLVGAWLAGTYDRDTGVARVAAAGVSSFLDSEDKVRAFWRRCQRQVLDYAQQAMEETVQTLSDERTVSPDDAEAKYDRVMGASLSLLFNLLRILNKDDVKKEEDKYLEILGEKKVWGFIASNDAAVRRTCSNLLRVILDKHQDLITSNIDTVGQAFIMEGLRANHTGSALAFVQALVSLTRQFPDAWKTPAKSKKTPYSRLQRFAEKGSFSGPVEYWAVFRELIVIIPRDVLPQDAESCNKFLAAIREGVTNRGESRLSVPAGWLTYFSIANHIARDLSDLAAKRNILESSVYPYFDQYVHPSPEKSSWSCGNNLQPLRKAFQLAYSLDAEDSLTKEWQKLSDLLVENMQISLPEQSKDHAKSQDSVASEGQRWVNLQTEVLQSAESEEVKSSIAGLILPSTITVVRSALDLLTRRHGKPYGAAAVLKSALSHLSQLLRASDDTLRALALFFKEQLPELITSASSSHLILSLHSLAHYPGQEAESLASWKVATDRLLCLPDSLESWKILQALISNEKVKEMVHEDSALQSYLIAAILAAARGELQSWPLLESVLIFDSLSVETSNLLIRHLIDQLDTGSNADGSIQALEIISSKRPSLLRKESGNNMALITKLLALTELSDSEQNHRFLALKKAVEVSEHGTEIESSTKSPLLEIIQDNLRSAGPQSLAIDTLIDQATNLSKDVVEGGLVKLFPDVRAWRAALDPIISLPTSPAISITNPLHGALALVEFPPPSKIDIARDMDGFSIPLRMAMYTTKLFDAQFDKSSISPDEHVELLLLLSLTIELANDQLGLRERNKLWAFFEDDEQESEVQSFLSGAQTHISTILGETGDWRSTDGNSSVGSRFVARLLQQSQGHTVVSFYAARALSGTLSTLVEVHGWQASGGEDWLTQLKVLSTATTNVIAATAVLTGLRESLAGSKVVSNLCNRLISEIPDAKADSPKTLGLLVMLNACFDIYEDGALPVAQNRLVFAVRQITTWLDSDDFPPAPVSFESCRALTKIFPVISQIYGSYWETALTFCSQIWTENAGGAPFEIRLPEIYATLKLATALESLSTEGDEEDQNDDLKDAITAFQEKSTQGLLSLLAIPRERENQPVSVVDQLLYRRAKTLSIKGLDTSDVYPLLASNSRLVQLAAFDILHRAIPAAQEQISVEAVLDKSGEGVRLPDELLSLLLDVPSASILSEDSGFPIAIRGYLLSLHLVFDSYTNASYKVRSDYTENLKSENYIAPFLALLSEILGHTSGKPLNLSRENFTDAQITSYDVDLAESEPELRNMQWLFIHVYYLCLINTPQLVKNWYLDERSKQTRLAIENWTETYFSPLVISSLLQDVQLWAESEENQSTNDEEQPLLIKVSPKSREIYAGYEVDETQMKIVIRLPPAFPLDGVKVESVNRVAVPESKWQSWMRITQGVITFSNSITDGLSIFRKNIVGALKGQTECAICYSLISSDRKLPDKRCQVCKKLFHASCLFKWFSSSNQSSCPLCRNPFQYADAARRRMAVGLE